MKDIRVVAYSFIILWLVWTLCPAQQTTDAYFNQARKLLNSGQNMEAADIFNKIITLVPAGSELEQNARYWVGQCYFRAGRLNEALFTFNKLIKDYPEDAIVPVTQLMIGRVNVAKKNQQVREAAAEISESGVIIAPESGIQFKKIHTFIGKNDVIKYTNSLRLSPNGKFILHDNLVVPLENSPPFELSTEISVTRASWSPDGKQIAFYSRDAICIVPVSPETARPTGPVKKVIPGRYIWQANVSWSPDGEKIVFGKRDEESSGELYTLSLIDGSLGQITSQYGGYHPAWSPDGKTIAYGKNYRSLCINSVDGQNEQEILDPGHRCFPFWSPDGKWLGYTSYGIESVFLIRLTDRRVLEVILPKEVGDFLSWSSDGKKLLFYRPSFGGVQAVKIVSASGGPSFAPARDLHVRGAPQWSPDGKMILIKRRTEPGAFDSWAIPFSGGDPVLLQMDTSISGKIHQFKVSRDGNKLAFKVEKEDKTEDIYIISISLRDKKTIGTPVKVFENWYRPSTLNANLSSFAALSPDGQRLAVIHKGDLWITSVDGKQPVQLTKTPDTEDIDPIWSPDGNIILFWGNGLKLISPAGGEIKQIVEAGIQNAIWLPNSKEVFIHANKVFSVISIDNGKKRQIAKLEDLDLNNAYHLSCSPDGEFLTFVGQKKSGEGSFIFKIPINGGELIELAADDSGGKNVPIWSPNGQWVAYLSNSEIKIRPGGTIWEADFAEILDKLLE